MYLDDPVTQAFFDVAREELRAEREIVSEHFPLPQPYREDYHPSKAWPKGGAIPCENSAVLLQAGDLKPKDSDVEKGRVLKTVRRNVEGWTTKREVKEAKLAM